MSRTSAARAERWGSLSWSSRLARRFENLDHGVLGGDPVPLDPRPGVGPKGGVGDHPGVGGEDVGVLGAEPAAGVGLGLRRQPSCSVEALLKPHQLGGHGVGGDLAMGQPQPQGVERHHRADRDAGADGDPLEDLHRLGVQVLVAQGCLRKPSAASQGSRHVSRFRRGSVVRRTEASPRVAGGPLSAEAFSRWAASSLPTVIGAAPRPSASALGSLLRSRPRRTRRRPVGQRLDGQLGVGPTRLEFQPRTAFGGQRRQVEDALAVELPSIIQNVDVGLDTGSPA